MSFGPEDILRTQMAQEAFNASQTIAKLKSELATLRAESDALKRERDELFRWRIEAQDELIKCGYTIGKLHEAEEVLSAQLQQAREERDALKSALKSVDKQLVEAEQSMSGAFHTLATTIKKLSA